MLLLQEICHRDLKLENTLLDGSATPCLKICDFGYSKVGAYPFEDPEDPRNFCKTIGRIMNVQYSIPDYVHVSSSCRELLSRIFVANPSKVIDYKTQQSRLFPLLATTYAYRFVGEWLKWLYKDVTQRLQSCDFSTLSEAHACTAGLKSLTTSITA
ncbi:hypothetical protein IFM89_014463, partial [Coptis chinensis]